MAYKPEWGKDYRATEAYRIRKRARDKSESYKEWRRKYRKRIGYSDAHKYEKTPNGFLMRLYRNMKSRITGVQKLKSRLYKGKELLEKEDFYEWAKSSPIFWELYEKWKENDFSQSLTPSVNRIDAKRGYTIDNIEWLTHGENSRLTSRLRKKI